MIGPRLAIIPLLLLPVSGCQSPPKPIFPTVSPPIVWPPPPDLARIRYVGELHGEASLGARPSDWNAFRAVLTGPRPVVMFSRPTALAVVGARVFVTDTGLGVVHLLDLANRHYDTIRGAPDDGLQVPVDVAALPDGTIAVADRGRAAIDIFDQDGKWLFTLRHEELKAPAGVTWDALSERLWVIDAANHTCFAWQDRQLVDRLGRHGNLPGQFNYPTAAAWHPLTGLVVADAMNFRVQVFGDNHEPAAIFGKKGDAAGDFARPRDVAMDSAGHIYVLDNQFENVQIFDHEGRLLMAFGGGGQDPGQFALPSGITIDDQDRIWIADSYNHRVQVFQYLPEDEPCAR